MPFVEFTQLSAWVTLYDNRELKNHDGGLVDDDRK